MKPIQFILVPVLLFLIILFWRKLKGHPFLKWLVSGILTLMMVFTIFLESSTKIANTLGIGRGVDFVTYVALLSLTIVCIFLYLRTVRLERMITEMVRENAISEVRKKGGSILPHSHSSRDSRST